MSVLESLRSRKSVRMYLDKDVSQDIINKLFEAVRWCPSSKNIQPWKVAVVCGEHQKSLLSKMLKAFESGVKPCMEYNYDGSEKLEGDLKNRAVECGKALYSVLNIEREDKEKRMEQWKKNYLSFGAPVSIFIFKYPQTGISAYIDNGMLLQSIMLAADELGLATCPQAALAQYPNIVKEELGVDQDLELLFGISLGYEDKSNVINNYRTAREPVESFVTFFD